MTEPCDCTTNPNPHTHNYLRPLTVAAAIGRPFKTVDSWRRRGEIASTGSGYGQLKVCVCCAAEQDTKTSVRWVKRNARRSGRTIRAKRARAAA